MCVRKSGLVLLSLGKRGFLTPSAACRELYRFIASDAEPSNIRSGNLLQPVKSTNHSVGAVGICGTSTSLAVRGNQAASGENPGDKDREGSTL